MVLSLGSLAAKFLMAFGMLLAVLSSQSSARPTGTYTDLCRCDCLNCLRSSAAVTSCIIVISASHYQLTCLRSRSSAILTPLQTSSSASFCHKMESPGYFPVASSLAATMLCVQVKGPGQT